jgi:broad specificity phosphatase PhoE
METARLVCEEYHSYDFRPFGGESRDDVLARHLSVIKKLNQGNETSTILMIGHGKGLNTLLAGLGKMPNLSRGDFHVLEV